MPTIARTWRHKCHSISLLSIFPFFIVVAALIGWLPSTTLWQSFAQWITDYLPTQSRRVIFETILGLSHGYTGFLSFGLLATLWTASSGFVSLMESLSVAYGGRDTRSYWKKRGIALLATMLMAVFLIASFGLLAAGASCGAFLVRPGGHREHVSSRMGIAALAGNASPCYVLRSTA